jgi:glycosyltransferase involved in cell wall biosynthesis
MSLRIAWASPWNERSAIAQFGAEIVGELTARGHTVDILRTETGEWLQLPPRPAPGQILGAGHLDGPWLRRNYDVTVVNLGDHFGFHGAAVERLAGLGAVAILHDAYYANLVAGTFAGWYDAEPGLRRIVQATYGRAAMPAGHPYWLPMDDMRTQRSMLEWFAGPNIGAVVHAAHYAGPVRAVCPGPVAEIPLAFADPGVPPPKPIGDSLTIVAVGHVNPNRCVEQVIRAIGGSPELRRRCRYRLIGPCDDAERARLSRLAADLGVQPLEFVGWVADADFADALGQADVICCLRNPVLEGASASAVIGLFSARPMLVSDHGCYGEIPDGLVAKCAPGQEERDVARHLTAILEDPAAAQAMGRRARAHAATHHSAGAYTDALLPFLARTIEGGPAILASLEVGQVLASFGLEPGDPAAARAISPLQSLIETAQF